MSARAIPRLLTRRLPFFYGWVILGCVCCAGFSRQGGAVSTLTIFVEPMTQHFGWSRTAISGAVSLGGLLAALTAPALGRLLDRQGARAVLCWAILLTGLANTALSATGSLLTFYILFCIARMNFAGPFDLGIYGAVNNWFVARRSLTTAIATLAQMLGLVLLPLIAEFGIAHGGWRAGWLAVGFAVLAVGFVPTWLLLVGAPEDIGLVPDHQVPLAMPRTVLLSEPTFTRAEALRTPAFWLLTLFTLFAYPVQAGVSLHQAPFLIERGLSPVIAASVVSTFSLMSSAASLAFGFFPRSLPIRYALALIALLQCFGVLVLLGVHAPPQAYFGAAIFGAGIGGLMTMLPIAWADYYGRRSYGAIRGLALTGQVLAQAAGPLLSGVLRDRTGSYNLPLECFATISALAILAALAAWPPRIPSRK
ncbi:MAG TPA: MFS transporter [Acetobacteraceae bacterium]|nr:MFS transporter [Acetobacteraceae bacterium]